MMNQYPFRKILPQIGSMGRPFLKMHGLRNHFIIVDGREQPFKPTIAAISRICDPHEGVGAEQLLIIENPTTAGRNKGAEALMRIINIDGREAEACGNATRCVAYLILEEKNAEKIILETITGTLECWRAGEQRVSVNMGHISKDWWKIPLSEAQDTCHLDISNGPLKNPVALNIGNPHVVFFVNDLKTIVMEDLCPAIQTDPLFPNQINVGVAQMVTDSHMLLAVYERPGILTEACGSGACVAFYAARLRGLTDRDKMTVELPAGPIEVAIQPDDSVVMTGPVAFCFGGFLLEK
ncbi:diaminopimelate epimerase [Desulfuromusa kysingii]|uniref:Diaminopimelate epimerase n=1 Tax=Desulfuromusa kysingii TaxID=37625 RepID=A0A1H4D2G6_9BACT|nr:diaminopimelate epimerase [Desulfuromusa kysingii]SEA66778.1 diaminopimelate epimerase [Desulfuromusa kysingii]